MFNALSGSVFVRKSVVDGADITVNVKGDKSDDDTRPPDCDDMAPFEAYPNLAKVRVELRTSDCSTLVAEAQETDVDGNAQFIVEDGEYCATAMLETLPFDEDDPDNTIGPFRVYDTGLDPPLIQGDLDEGEGHTLRHSAE